LRRVDTRVVRQEISLLFVALDMHGHD